MIKYEMPSGQDMRKSGEASQKPDHTSMKGCSTTHAETTALCLHLNLELACSRSGVVRTHKASK